MGKKRLKKADRERAYNEAISRRQYVILSCDYALIIRHEIKQADYLEKQEQEKRKLWWTNASAEAQKSHRTLLEKFDLVSRHEIEISKRCAQTAVKCAALPFVPPRPPVFIHLPALADKDIGGFPSRPVYPEQVLPKEDREQIEIDAFVKFIDQCNAKENVSLFEHNLKVWRQLWRCLSVSDVVCLFADVRFPLFHFPHAVYNHLKEIGKPCLVVLTKVDLVSTQCATDWINYFKTKFNLPVVPVISRDSSKNQTVKQAESGASNIFEIAKQLRDAHVRTKANNSDSTVAESTANSASSTGNGSPLLTIGMVGQPNVGKSSVINQLKGEKVVSVSSNPGHTKWTQDVHISDEIKLCDCPGLVFPLVGVDRSLQILLGLVPLAKMQEPWNVLAYIMRFIPIQKLLNLKKDKSFCDEFSLMTEAWSPWEVASAYAILRKYVTKGNLPDVFKASKEIVSDIVEGRIVLFTLPELPTPENIESYLAAPVLPEPKKRETKIESKSSSESESDSEDESSEEDTKQSNLFSLLVANAKQKK